MSTGTTPAELKMKVSLDKTKAAVTGTAQKVQQGVQAGVDAARDTKPQADLINILGEQVSLGPSGLSPQETAIVEFDSYYVPKELQTEEVVILKNIMRALFDNVPKDITDVKSGKELDQRENETYPPCGDYEKALVLASLLFRARKLRQQLYEQGILNREQMAQQVAQLDQPGAGSVEGRNTALARTQLQHLDKIQKFIDKYDEEQKCIDIGELAFKDLGLELSDEQIQKLLKQFIFFILQTKYPLKEFRTKDPSAQGFVRRLQKKPIDFDPFLGAYTKAGQAIPASIAKVLDSIKGNNELLQKEVLNQVDEEKKKLIENIASRFPDGDPLLRTLLDTKDPALIIDRLRSQVKEQTSSFRTLDAEKTRLQSNLKACDEAKAALSKRLKEIEAQVQVFQKQAEGKAALEAQLQELQETQKAAVDALNKKIAEVTAQRDALQTKLNEKDAEILRLTKLNEELTARAEQAERELAALQEIKRLADSDLDALKAKHQAELAAKDALLTTARQRSDAAVEEANRVQGEKAGLETQLAALQARLLSSTDAAARANEAVAEKQRLLTEAEAASAKKSTDIANKEEALVNLAAEKAEMERERDRMEEAVNEIGRQLTSEKEKSGTKVGELETEIGNLEEQLAALQTKLDDCTAQQEKLRAENESLKETQRSEEEKLITGLRGELAAAEEKVKSTEARKSEAEAEILALKAQLEGEQGKVATLTKEKEQTLQNAKDQLEKKDQELLAAKDLQQKSAEEAADKTKKLDALQAKYDEEVATHEAAFTEQGKRLDAEFSARIEELGEGFKRELAKGSADAQARIAGLADKFEEDLNASTAEYDKLRKVVEQIATSVDTGREVEIEGAPQKEALEKIVTKLKGTASSGVRIDSSINHCYLVFLTSYLWRLVFGGTNEEHSTNIQYILTSTFRGGKEKATSVPGLYADFGCSKEKAHLTPIPQALEDEEAKACECEATSDDECEVVYGLQETTVIKNYLEYIGKLLTRMVDTTYSDITETIKFDDQKKQQRFSYFLASFLTKLRIFRNQIPEYKPNKSERYVFLDTCTKHYSEFFKPAKGIVTPEGERKESRLQDKYLVVLSTGAITIETRATKGSDGRVEKPFPTQPTVNYAILFFAYIVLLRDYLNHVGETGKDLCRLPKYLEA